MLKRFLCIFFALMMCLSTSVFAFADGASTEYKSDDFIVGNYHIVETICDDNRIVREMVLSPVNLFSSNDDDIKGALAAVGFDEAVLDNLSDEELNEYSQASRICTVTTFVKTDADGVSSYVSESDALQAAAVINAEEEALRSAGDWKYNEAITEDRYMKLTFTVVFAGDSLGSFTSSVDARWLTMPLCRGKDGIGATSQLSTFTPGTESAYYTYTKKTYYNGNLSSTVAGLGSKTAITTFKSVSDGTFWGRAAIFQLPLDTFIEDSNGNTTQEIYTNLFVHMEYKGKVNLPQQQMNINAAATYAHAEIQIIFSPGITLKYKSSAASIGLTLTEKQTQRDAYLELNYYP